MRKVSFLDIFQAHQGQFVFFSLFISSLSICAAVFRGKTRAIIREYISIINISYFFYKFNQNLYKLQKKYLYSYFRGYYINTLYLYSTNMDTKNITLCNSNLYFVLYDFNTDYLDYIYYNILQSVKYPAKIKYLKNTHSDKYSINDLTDTIPYKLVFLHKTKYYHNIIYKILSLLFTSIENDGYLNDVELDLYTLYTRLEVK